MKTTHATRRQSVVYRLVLALSLLTLSVGCQTSDDPRQIQISGNVTINGEPVKTGKIMFSPTGENQGAAGIASIINGRYRTKGVGGKGVIGGLHRVDIECFVEAPGDNEELIEGEPMPANFNNPIPKGHKEEWDIPTDKTNIKKDFDIEV